MGTFARLTTSAGLAAALLAAGAGSASAQPASILSIPPVIVSPASGLVDGQEVTVSWRGVQAPFFGQRIVQCADAGFPTTLSGCDVLASFPASASGSRDVHVTTGYMGDSLWRCPPDPDEDPCRISVVADTVTGPKVIGTVAISFAAPK